MTDRLEILWEGAQSKKSKIETEKLGLKIAFFGFTIIFLVLLPLIIVISEAVFKTHTAIILISTIYGIIFLNILLFSLIYYYHVIPSLMEKHNPVSHYILTSKKVIREERTLRGKKKDKMYNMEEIKYVIISEDEVTFYKEIKNVNELLKEQVKNEEESMELYRYIFFGLLLSPGICFTGIESGYNELVETIHSKMPLREYEPPEDEKTKYKIYIRAI